MKVKGVFLSGTLEYVKYVYGEEYLNKILNRLTEEEHQILCLQIPDHAWYDYELYLKLSKLLIDELFNGDIKQIRKIGEYTAQKAIKTPYRIFVKLGSPGFIISKASKAFASYFDFGKMETLSLDKNSMVVELSECSFLDEVCLERIAGWMEKIIEISGGKNSHVDVDHIKKDGATVFHFNGNWE